MMKRLRILWCLIIALVLINTGISQTTPHAAVPVSRTTPGPGGAPGTSAPSFPYTFPGPVVVNIDSLSALEAFISWSYPSSFIPATAELVYENSYDTTSFTIFPPSAKSGNFRRTIPPGAFESWRVIVTDRKGTSLIGEASLGAVYGGIIVVEEDIIFTPVNTNCGVTILEDTAFYFVNRCIVAKIENACKYDLQFFEEFHVPGMPVDEGFYTDFVLEHLQHDLDHQVPGVYDCSVLGDPDGYNPDVRTAARMLPQIESEVYPNPVEDRVIVNINHLSGEATLTIHNLQGQRIATHRLTLTGHNDKARISTASWTPGLYQLTIHHEEGSRTHRLLKR